MHRKQTLINQFIDKQLPTRSDKKQWVVETLNNKDIYRRDVHILDARITALSAVKKTRTITYALAAILSWSLSWAQENE